MTRPHRLILFDLDGTLVMSKGLGRRALEEAFLERYGWQSATRGVSFGGMTDPLIVRQVFLEHGRSPEEARREQAELLRRYIQLLEQSVAEAVPDEGPRCWALPGAAPLLRHLGDRTDCLVGVLTGNVEQGARIKLRAAGLGDDFFRVGAFGDEAEARNDLLPVALERANRHLGEPVLTARDVVVVGDTPKDIAVAKAHAARAVVVATGVSPRAELEQHEPDVLLEDLSHLQTVLAAIFT